MHVGWVAVFTAPEGGRLPKFAELREHIARRLAYAPRYRQKLAEVPLGLNTPEWTDDRAFSVDRHVYHAPGPLEDLVDEVMSIPLRRDRPLWEMWVCEDTGDGRMAIVGKTHHCMVDGLAAVQLASLLLDPTPETVQCEPDGWSPAAEPSDERLIARGLRDLASQQLDLVNWTLRMASSPAPMAKQTASGALRVTRALSNLVRAAPPSVLNEQLSPHRSLAWTRRPLADLQTIKRAYGTTVNDVILAAVAGGMRTYLTRRGQEPLALKAMVPVSVRSEKDVLGNHISFVFAQLPCDEPDPVGRLYQVHASMIRSKRDGEPEGADMVLKAANKTPVVVQQTLSRLIAAPRSFNLVVSNIPGPTVPMYMLGCPLQAAYPVVPLSDNHAVSVGMLTVDDQACFGVYADRQVLPDAHMLARDIDGAIAELLASTQQVMESAGSLLTRAYAATAQPITPYAAAQQTAAPLAPAQPALATPPAPQQPPAPTPAPAAAATQAPMPQQPVMSYASTSQTAALREPRAWRPQHINGEAPADEQQPSSEALAAERWRIRPESAHAEDGHGDIGRGGARGPGGEGDEGDSLDPSA
jgi:WS/DGAT/MGAT family acyltransferase